MLDFLALFFDLIFFLKGVEIFSLSLSETEVLRNLDHILTKVFVSLGHLPDCLSSTVTAGGSVMSVGLVPTLKSLSP